jgi:hypothetical protein
MDKGKHVALVLRYDDGNGTRERRRTTEGHERWGGPHDGGYARAMHGRRARRGSSAPERRVPLHFGEGLFDQNKLKIFEWGIEISKYKTCRSSIQIQLL